MNPQKPTKLDGNDTTTLFTPSLHLVPFYRHTNMLCVC